MGRKFILVCIAGLSLFACTTTKRLSTQNIQFMYDRQYQNIFPEYRVFNVNDTIADLFVRVNAADLLYVRYTGESTYKANYKLSWRLYSDFDQSLLIDSASIAFSDSLFYDMDVSLVDNLTIPLKEKGKFILIIEFWDLNRKNVVSDFVSINNTQSFSGDNFLFFVSDSVLLFNSFIPPAQVVDILYQKPETFSMKAEYYSQAFELPPPPFVYVPESQVPFKVDSVLDVNFINGRAKVNLSPSGFYYFHPVDDRSQGFILHRYQSGFPFLLQAEDLLGPLRFITSSSEFNELAKANNLKEAIDDFWVKIAGSQNRATELIGTFYNRVQEANVYYTSYKPGWMTDRGMVFIAMGPPHAVYRTNDTETWKYYENRETIATTFRFVKRKLIFSNNDFELERSAHYKNAWYLAVDNWRR